MSETPSFDQKLQELRGQRLNDLDQVSLRKLVDAHLREQAELESELDVLREKLSADLDQHDARRFRDIQGRARRLGEQWNELEDDLDDARRALRYRVLEDRLIAKLGSRFRLIGLDIFIGGLIIIVLGLLFWEFVAAASGDPLSHQLLWYFFLLDTACCGLFLADFGLRISCSDDKWRYLREHWIDLVTSIPIPPSEAMADMQLIRLGRAARLVRVLRLLRFLRLVRVVVLFWRGMDKLKEVTDVKLMKRSLRDSAFALFVGGLAVVYFEGQLSNELSDLPDGIWWSFTTMVVGGYGDIHNPETLFGQLVTVILVIIGMILTGIFTATLTAIVVGDESEDFRNQMEDMKEAVDRINQKLAELPADDNA